MSENKRPGAIYCSENAEGKEEYKTFEEVNAELLARADHEEDPIKPGFLPYMLNGSVQGGATFEAKMRSPAHAFLHIVSWDEFRPFLSELDAVGIDCSGIKNEPQFREDGGMIDCSWEALAQQVSPVTASILQRILVARGADPRRGDAIRMQFVSYRCYGVYFYDGKQVILPEDEPSDYFRVPSEFKVPTEFPIDYWEHTTFTGYSHTGDICFDVAIIKDMSELKPVKTMMKVPICTVSKNGTRKYGPGTEMREATMAHVCTLTCKNSDWLLVVVNSDDDEPDSAEAGAKANAKAKLAEFLETGRCWDVEHLYRDWEQEKCGPVLGDWNPKHVIVV